jgi:type IV pilus assembly protein PilA
MRIKKTIKIIAILSIIGFILAIIIVPQYSDYTIRAQVSEGIILGENAKIAVEEYYEKNKVFPNDNAMAGIPLLITGKYTSSVKIYNNKIVATFGLDAHKTIQNKDVKLTAISTVDKDKLTWKCSFNGDSRDAPSSCKNE